MIYVPSTVLSNYLTADVWSEIADNIYPYRHGTQGDDFIFAGVDDGTGHDAFELVYYCGSDETVVIPDEVMDRYNNLLGKVVGIRSYAFNSLVKNVKLGKNIEVIYDYAFSRAISLESVNFVGSKLKTIGAYAFSECRELTSIALNGITTLESIGEYCFKDCLKISALELGNTVKNIGTQAFSGLVSLVTAVLPESVLEIGDRIFYGCSNLTALSVKPMLPPVLNGNGLFGGEAATKIYFNTQSQMDAYLANNDWKGQYNRMLVAD